MKYLITGATGFVGKHLVSELLGSGHSVTVLGRSAEKVTRAFGNAVQFHYWDPNKPLAPEAFEGIEVVIHLAGEGIADRRWSRQQKQRIYDSRVQGTKNLVSAMNALGTKAPKVFVSASAIGFYGDRGGELLTEQSEMGSGFLSDVCVTWEQEIFNASKDIRSVALRIGIVFGREGGALKKLLPLFSLGLGGPVGTGNQWMSWIHVKDLVALFIEASRNENYRGPVNAVAPNPVTNKQFSGALGKALGRPAIFTAPAMALKLAMGELSVLVLSSQKVEPKLALKNKFPYQYSTIYAALEDIAKKKEQILETYQVLPKTGAEIFPFFCDERNLEVLTPPWLHFKVLRKSGEISQPGTNIDYYLKVHGIPLRWQSRILDWKVNKSFIDEQVRGPYRLWHHTHEFFPVEGGTLMRDRVRYEVPHVPLIKPIIERFVAKDLEKIFEYRRKQIEREFGFRD